MKKTRSNKTKIAAALFLTCLMIGLYLVGSNVTYALFSDRDAKERTVTHMATVDIELQQSFDPSNGRASFTVENNSNIDIYLRAGIIFEILGELGEPLIADTSGISITISDSMWEVQQKTLSYDNNSYTKWFLKYGRGTDYAKLHPSENRFVGFNVTGIPDGCTLIVNVVPEAVQADADNDALEDFKNAINPPW